MENTDLIETVKDIGVWAENRDLTLEEMLEALADFEPDELGMTPEAAANVYALIAEKVPAAHGRLFFNPFTPVEMLPALAQHWPADLKAENLSYLVRMYGSLPEYAPKIQALAAAILNDPAATDYELTQAIIHAAII